VKTKILFIIFLFLNLTSSFAEDIVEENEGILIIDVHAKIGTGGEFNSAYGAWLRNIKTGKTYGLARKALMFLVLPEGIYCVDEIELLPRGTGTVGYCGEPYINVVRGRLNNAGQWSFLVDLRDETVELKSSVLNPEKTLQDVKTAFPDFF